ncbi:MAG: hypothetical protein ACOX2P_03650 [Bacillota bacterium]
MATIVGEFQRCKNGLLSFQKSPLNGISVGSVITKSCHQEGKSRIDGQIFFDHDILLDLLLILNENSDLIKGIAIQNCNCINYEIVTEDNNSCTSKIFGLRHIESISLCSLIKTILREYDLVGIDIDEIDLYHGFVSGFGRERKFIKILLDKRVIGIEDLYDLLDEANNEDCYNVLLITTANVNRKAKEYSYYNNIQIWGKDFLEDYIEEREEKVLGKISFKTDYLKKTSKFYQPKIVLRLLKSRLINFQTIIDVRVLANEGFYFYYTKEGFWFFPQDFDKIRDLLQKLFDALKENRQESFGISRVINELIKEFEF